MTENFQELKIFSRFKKEILLFIFRFSLDNKEYGKKYPMYKVRGTRKIHGQEINSDKLFFR